MLAGNEKVKVHYKPGLKVPYATPDGSIYVATPKVSNLLDWSYNVHHEVSHAFPAHKYHFDAMGKAKGAHGELGGYILNIVVDNLAERYQFNRYEGRRMILSKGRLECIKKQSDVLFPDEPEVPILHGLLAWDCEQRASWMGYPFEMFLSPVDKYEAVVKHLEDIGLADLMDKQETADDLVEIVGKILEFKSDEDNDNKGSSEADSSDDSDGDVANGDVGDPSADDSEEENEEGDVNDQSSGEGVPEETEETEGDSESDAGTNGSDGQEQGSSESDQQQDGTVQVNNRPDVGGKPVALNVSEETKKVMAEYLMESDQEVNTEGKYEPEAGKMTWLSLTHTAFPPMIRDIERVSGGSKLTKQIQRHLRAISQTSYDYGKKSGKLSNKSIYKCGSGSTSIFKQKTATRIEKDTAICVLTDCSASMSNQGSGSSEDKVTVAFASIAIMADTLFSLRIPFEVLGFTDEVVERGFTHRSIPAMIEFKAYNENLNRGKVVERLARCPELSNNLDAEAVLESASRLMARPEKNKILIVLSDGNPVGHFALVKYAAHDYLKEVCKHIEDESPIDLLSIGICDKSVSMFYKNYQVVNNVKDLDRTLLTLLKDRLIK